MDPEYEPEPVPSDGGGLRRQLEAALARAKELEQSLPKAVEEAEARGALQAQRRFEALRIFGEDKPKLAESWVASNPDGVLSKEAAAEFASAFGVKLEETPSTEPAPEPVTAEVKEAVQAFQQPTAAASTDQLLERAEFDQMMKDPARRGEALRAAQQGRVRLNNPEVARETHIGGLPIRT